MTKQEINRLSEEGNEYLSSSYPGDQYDRPDTDDSTPDPYGDNYPFDDDGNEVDNRPELLPGAVAQYVEGKYEHRIAAIKALRQDYSTGLAYAKYSVDVVYPMNSAQSIITKYAARQDIDEPKYVEQDNPQVEQIDTLRDIQRQMLDLLDELKYCSREIEDSGNGGIAARLNTYVIAHLECTVTSEHIWLDSSTSIDSIIEELEEA